MSGPPDDRMSELRELFFESATELVEKLNEEALSLEKNPGDAETARSLRRIVHTLKGDAAACGYRELSELAHEFEDVLALKTNASVIPEVAMRAADVFGGLIHAYHAGEKLPDIHPLRKEIARLAHPEQEPANAKAPDSEPEDGADKKPSLERSPWSEYERLAIAHAAADGKTLHHVVVRLDPQCGMPIAARQMIQIALAGLGEVLAVHPADESKSPIERVQVALASQKSVDQIRVKCDIPTIAQSVDIRPLQVEAPLNEAKPPANQAEEARPAGAVNADAGDVPTVTGTASHSAATSSDNILRVDAERIDSVLNLVGELILAKSMLQQTFVEFGQRFPKDALRGKFSDAMAFQSRVLSDLQQSVMKIRMVPVDQLFRRFPRVVRDVARQGGKEVELAIQGGDTDLDKGILDSVAEPLMHILRNAVGHGIETPEERTRAGKRPQGKLQLKAYHQGNQVVIEVSDDGRGINIEKVRQRALVQRLLKPDEASLMSDADTLELILRPGFSTAEEITELSGRGIGLDVVQTVLTRLKGSVQIETAPGRGTTFRLRLPLTLAILRALLFRVDHRLYALPLNAVNEITRTTESEIHEVEHYEVLQLRNDVLPLMRLGAAPQPDPEAARQKIFVLVIHQGDRKFGLIVNELAGEDELVIKALDDQSIKTDLVSGASILGDGRVVLILNLLALLERFSRSRGSNSKPISGPLSNLSDACASQAPRVHHTAGGHA
ncbi:MAG TPA: chemotaxis protein CheA [Terriglobales bacterium]|nr:chemotaxis protein CheA [Terriglobales bacterium]